MASPRSTSAAWRSAHLIAVLLVAAWTTSCVAPGQPAQAGGESEFSRLRGYDSLAELDEEADSVVTATVQRRDGSVVDSGGIAVARYLVEVEQSLKGPFEAGEEVKVVYTEVKGDDTLPTLVEGERFLLFLQPYAGPDGATDNHIIVGDWVGMYQEVGEDTFMLLDEESPVLPELLTLEEVASAVSDG